MNTLLTNAPDLTDLAQLDSANQLRHFALDRRTFLKVFGGGLLVCLTDRHLSAQESGRGFGGHALPTEVSAWIHISADNKVTVFTGKVEVGQNIRTSLAQLVADELMVPFDSITMVMGDTDLTPWDAGTFGSQTTPQQMGPRLRTMAAAARQTLVDTAAKKWTCDAADLTVANGKITTSSAGQSLTYGQLTQGEKRITTMSTQVPLLAAKDWKVGGTPSVPKANGREFVTGKHQYPSDIVLPGMMFGKVLRPDGFNATLDSVDTSVAEKMPGVKVVRDGDFIGVVAPSAWDAEQAVLAIKAKWTVPPQPSNANIFDYLKTNLESGGGGRGGRGGANAEADTTAPAAPAAGAISLAQSYTVQYIAHAPLEPRAAVAQWDSAGKLTVWTGTQRPFGVKDELVAAFHVDPAQVRVIQPDMGSGYGGKHTGDAAVEAARLAKAAGTPVKLVLDARRGVHVGLPASRRSDGAQSLCDARRLHLCLGAPQLQLRQCGPGHSVSRARSGDAVSRVEVAAAPGLVPRPGVDRQPLRSRILYG